MAEAGEQIINRSILYERQREMGASFVVSDGWEVAQSYSDAFTEHQAVRTNAGLIDLTPCGAIKIGGGERVQFLNGLVTNDVKTLAKGKGMRAAFLTGHGKVRALCRVFNLGDEYLVINDPQTHEKIFKYVFPFSYAGDFKVDDVSDHYRLLTVQGPKSHLVMKEVCFEPVPSLSEHDWFETLIAGHRVMVARASHTSELGFDVFAPVAGVNDIWDFILLKGAFHALVPFGAAALDSLRIEAGIPVYGVDVDETNMMLEVGLDDAVSFTKGCYTGQEAVAMATYRGHVSKKLSGVKLSGDVAPKHGDVVTTEGKQIGSVTSALASQSIGSPIALAYLKYGFFEPGSAVDIEIDSGSVPASVVQLPFYNPSE